MSGTEPTELKRQQEVVAATRGNCSIDSIGCTRCCISARVACHSVVAILILLLLLEAACFIEGACCMLQAHWPGRTTPTHHSPLLFAILCVQQHCKQSTKAHESAVGSINFVCSSETGRNRPKPLPLERERRPLRLPATTRHTKLHRPCD